ncbi:MAG TPA: class I SAM-dependent methyltransferase [Candidatus Limnocylindrales bacterium]|nr:class I SAM-dependent methyltransferase [Candidatus Limnocylindrales bacterium]
MLNRLDLFGIGVEVGVFRGEFAKIILERWRGDLLALVDPWQNLPNYKDSWNLPDGDMEANYRITIEAMRPFTHRVKLLRMNSLEAAKRFSDESCDFVYIDANHSYDSVRLDLAAWYPKVRKGGLFGGHDYFNAIADENLEPIRNDSSSELSPAVLSSYGVKAAVDEFASRQQVQIAITDEDEPTWYFRKR